MSKIKEFRIKKGYTQKEISKILGISQSTFSEHENGKSLLNANQIKILAVLFDCTTDVLLDMNNETQFKKIQEDIAKQLTKNYIKR